MCKNKQLYVAGFIDEVVLVTFSQLKGQRRTPTSWVKTVRSNDFICGDQRLRAVLLLKSTAE